MTTTQPESLRLAEILNDGYPLTYDAKAAAAELRRQHARITELEAQLAQRFDAADMATASVLYDPKAVLDVFNSARAGSEKPVGYMRGILAVIAHWESRPEPHRWMVPVQADSVQEDACHAPPLGWRCTRKAGHEGPCAAVEYEDDQQFVERGMQRIRDAEDAARYRWLREGNDAKHGAAWHVAVNLYGCEWDAAIDTARKQGEKQ